MIRNALTFLKLRGTRYDTGWLAESELANRSSQGTVHKSSNMWPIRIVVYLSIHRGNICCQSLSHFWWHLFVWTMVTVNVLKLKFLPFRRMIKPNRAIHHLPRLFYPLFKSLKNYSVSLHADSICLWNLFLWSVGVFWLVNFFNINTIEKVQSFDCNFKRFIYTCLSVLIIKEPSKSI